MKPDSPLKSKSVFPILVGAVVLALAAVTGFVAHTLFQSQQRYFDEADNASRNLSGALDNALQSHFQEVDLTLQRAPANSPTCTPRGALPPRASAPTCARSRNACRRRRRSGARTPTAWSCMARRSIRPNRWT
ncbi:hypothetical protein LP419_35380 [Massilia sp. H-1]|nr:hypothetical protein LP419_35380 [Massilia sp. H-1]